MKPIKYEQDRITKEGKIAYETAISFRIKIMNKNDSLRAIMVLGWTKQHFHTPKCIFNEKLFAIS